MAKKIVFIEDDPALQKALGGFLREQGYDVRMAADGAEGLAMAAREPPDLILLDLILPGMHGLEVLKAMRRDQTLQAVPVMVLTNVESNESVEQAIELGARAYLVKTSYSLDEVLSKIQGVLGGGPE